MVVPVMAAPVGHRRPETEVAADAVYAIFHVKLLPLTKENIALACRAAGLKPDDLRRAEARRKAGSWSAPRPPIATPGDPPPAAGRVLTPVPDRPSAPAAERPVPERPVPVPRTSRERAKQPTEALRMCRGPLHDPDEGGLVPTEDFALRNPRTGAREWVCRPCKNEIAKDRRLVLHQRAAAGEVLARFVLAHGDLDGEHRCPRCELPLVPGDAVVVAGMLEHDGCP